ncbi:hypothetical protein [Treponema pectinovorum]|uniref:hypothetical protein n=1 Tax=Treponema pectinovorum TaxID=164 RepID=UPI0011CC2A20|nr:hypothetical protein [Treponema pectinovorum]
MNLSEKKQTREALECFMASAFKAKGLEKRRNYSKKITVSQGLYIKYRLKCMGVTGSDIAFEVGCAHQAVYNVLSGKSHSRRIESVVASKLGYPSWNAMVQELRQQAA